MAGATALVSVAAAAAIAFVAVERPLVSAFLVCSAVFVIAALARPEIALLLLGAALPWEDMLAYPDNVLTIVKLLGLLVLAATAIALLRGSTYIRAAPAPSIAVVLLVLFVALSLLLSPDPDAGAIKVVSFFAFALFFFVLVHVLDSWQRIERFVAVACASAGLAALYGLVSFLIGDVPAAEGPIGNPNDYAFMLVALLPFQVELAWRRRATQPLWILFAALSLGAIFASLSRGALIGLGAAVLWLLLARRISLSGVLAGVALVALLAGIGTVFASDAFQDPLQKKQRFGAKTVAAREAYWTAAVEMGMDRPVSGIGPARFGAETDNYVRNRPVAERDPVVHNSYLEILAENGAPALAAFLVFLAATWRTLGAAERRMRELHDAAGARFATTIKAGLVAAVVAGAFISVQLSMPFWVFGALASAVALLELRRGARA